ncbi:hypothetical protein B0H63DRAFT_560892 [Podospora didyma]|uniref:Uncharacterized protein n=1 Tax=Podospora didyma TaxID=330526 RepID=A0AAE0NGP9_9PEZI|nr:hypothetical protein B0H63DRAFT_560892 [Podospora didyma]
MALTFPPNPCLSSLFQPPIYSFSNLTVAKTFLYTEPEGSKTWDDSFYGSVNFTLGDTANHYNLVCYWGPRDHIAREEEWGTENCVYVRDSGTVAVPPVESRIVALLTLDGPTLLGPGNKSLENPIKITQYWYCDPRDGRYPEVYQSRAQIFLNITCPDKPGNHTPTVPCIVATQQPLAVKAQWLPRGTTYPGMPQLIPHPSERPSQNTTGLDPPPSADCTDVSFTYPDWTMHSLEYRPPPAGGDSKNSSLDISLSSRVTGIRLRCRWGPEVGVFETWAAGDYYIIPACVPVSGTDVLGNSRSTMQVLYNRVTKELWMRHDWTCGDTKGTYSTDFHAEAEVYLPLYCAAGLCIGEQMKIKGYLTKPILLHPSAPPAPEGASTPDCFVNSHADQRLWREVWTITRFFWQATTARIDKYFSGQSSPFSRTLQLTLQNNANNVVSSCEFDDAVLDGPTDRWWPCFRQNPHDSPLKRVVETYIQFNATKGQLTINQTWYCNDTQAGTPYMLTGHAITPSPAGLACGTSNSTWNNAPCPLDAFWGVTYNCDITYSARWCTLGDRDGHSRWNLSLSPSPNDLTVMRLPQGELTEPEPLPGVWSCTASSLGHGPVVWHLRHGAEWGFAHGEWFSTSPAQNHVDGKATYLNLNLDSSVFSGTQAVADAGRIRAIGITRDEARARALTPWMRSFNPTIAYTDRTEYPGDGAFNRNPNWGLYNGLAWSVRLDLSTGYLELNHSWYCDDKNPITPILFNGTWNGYVPLNCTYDAGISCRFAGGEEYAVTPIVTHDIVYGKIPDRP